MCVIVGAKCYVVNRGLVLLEEGDTRQAHVARSLALQPDSQAAWGH